MEPIWTPRVMWQRNWMCLLLIYDELILIMVNFDSIPARSAVNIPQHAFDYLGIHRYGEYEATELLTGNTEKLTLMPDKTTPVLLDGMNGKILKFKL